MVSRAPGRACRDSGGILNPNQTCEHPIPPAIESGFHNLSAHYVSPLFINNENGDVEYVPRTDIRARTYRGSGVVDAAIDWIADQDADTPWMASVSFASVHTPVMQPPQALLTTNAEDTSNFNCAGDTDQAKLDQRELTTLMLEALDKEFARLLVSIGVASRNGKGKLKYNPHNPHNPHNTDTMIIILGDNGTLAEAVKLPFDPTRAKGTAYQTGVWVPLIVAGPLVNRPNREVRHMVNIADLYKLFGEIAGIDVPGSVPRKLDSMSMLPYLTNPKRSSIRSSNFTQVGANVQANGGINAPCTIGTACTQIPVSKSVCEDSGGIWWGDDPTDTSETKGMSSVAPDGFTYCCEVNEFVYDKITDKDDPNYDPTLELYDLQPLSAVAIRNDFFKVVRNSFLGNPEAREDANPTRPWIGPKPPNCEPIETSEFYEIDENRIAPQLD